MSIKDINLENPEGKALFSALIFLTTNEGFIKFLNKPGVNCEPDEVLNACLKFYEEKQLFKDNG